MNLSKKQLITIAIVIGVVVFIMVFVKVIPFWGSLLSFITFVIGLYLGYTAKKLPIIGNQK